MGTHGTGPEVQLDQYPYRRSAGDDPENMTTTDASVGRPVQAQDHILNEVHNIDHEIDIIYDGLRQLCSLRSQYLAATGDSNTASLQRQVRQQHDEIIAKYRKLVGWVRLIKSEPESHNRRNSAQVHRVDQRLKACIQHQQQLESAYQKSSREQFARQYRIVMPDATDAQVQEAVEENGNQRVFSLANVPVNSIQAQRVQTVRGRHEELQKIDQQMIELMLLFENLDSLVVQQQPAVISIEHRSDEVSDLVQNANIELDSAVKKARAARKKKWYCLCLCVLVVIIVVAVTWYVVKK